MLGVDTEKKHGVFLPGNIYMNIRFNLHTFMCPFVYRRPGVEWKVSFLVVKAVVRLVVW